MGPKLHLTECTDGYWLYDEAKGWNLSMRAKTAEKALVEALTYYQEKLPEVEAELNELREKVANFINQFVTEDEYEM